MDGNRGLVDLLGRPSKQLDDLKPNEIFVNAAGVGSIEVITALTSTNIRTAPGSGVI